MFHMIWIFVWRSFYRAGWILFKVDCCSLYRNIRRLIALKLNDILKLAAAVGLVYEMQVVFLKISILC